MATSIRQLKTSSITTLPTAVARPKAWSEVLKQYVVDEVVAVSASDQWAIWNELAEACADRGVIFRQLVVMPKPKLGRYHIDDAGNGTYFVSLETVPQEHLTLAIKRILDITGAIFGVLLCALIFPFYAIWLRMVSPGATVFRQQRLGRNGRFFTLYKFRTMRPNAEQELHELMSFNEMRGALFKIKNDPRVVTGGNFMRRTHLDELPQFWNVLLGDMSLVGTRPPTCSEAEVYENRHYRRLSMRPGITGLWQVAGNGEVHEFEDVVRLDCHYIDNWSLGLDLRLIGRTLIKVVRGAGW